MIYDVNPGKSYIKDQFVGKVNVLAVVFFLLRSSCEFANFSADTPLLYIELVFVASFIGN